MIPTVILAGFVLGRWWWSVPVLGVAWAVLLATTTDNVVDAGFLLGATAFGAANAAVGFAVHQAIRAVVLAFVRGARAVARR